MLQRSVSILVAVLLFACSGEKSNSEMNKTETAAGVITPENSIALFNGNDLTNWVRFVADSSADVNQIWTVSDSIIHCTGAVNGYIRTVNAYKNYKLTVEWRWTGEPGNSGVLLHMNGEDKVWPKCIEAQLKSGNAGDFYLVDGTTMKEQTDPTNRRVPKKAESSEFEPGKWNKYEITCSGNMITLIVNGTMQNTATETSVQSGKICLQSEGAPIDFRNVKLEPLN